MPRARNIKPALFKNELLGEADPLLTILFCGLWCLADRDGKLEDRPKRIKAEIFPYRECHDINGYLTVLEQLGFIERYKADGTAVIRVIEFAKHQSPHKTEKASELPDRPENTRVTCKEPLNNGALTDEAALIPDSLIPDSLIPDSLNKDEQATPACDLPSKPPSIPVQRIVDLYHEILPELPRIEKLTDARRATIQQRWREDLGSLDDWRSFYAAVRTSDFLMGRTDKPFRPNLEWLAKAGNFAKIIEGKYHETRQRTTEQPGKPTPTERMRAAREAARAKQDSGGGQSSTSGPSDLGCVGGNQEFLPRSHG